ncbi:MAG: HAMP domain-containing histidine kinase [Chloroflexales bacterium]|nr:HAMP domain-containing histidine kinase [Chloroflexales bacterium]
MSLTVRLGLTYLLITLVGLLLVGSGFVALAGRYLAGERERELSAQAEIYAALLGELADTPAQLQALSRSSPADDLLPAGTQARIFSIAGARIAGDPSLGLFPSRRALALVRPPFPLPASQVEGRLYAASAITGPAGPIGVVELSRTTAEDASLLRDLGGLVLQAALAAALVMAAVSALVARGIARPILGLTRRAERLAATYTPPELNHAARVAHEGPPWRARIRALRSADEIAQLDRSLGRLECGLAAYAARISELEQARARFYRSVSHDLRTPLTAISAALENLADSLPETQRAAVTGLEGEAARLGRLVDDLLRPPDDGRLALVVRAPVDLTALAVEVCALLEGRARRAGVELGARGDALSVPGDRDRLKQALINLVDNALRISPPGGAVLVRVEPIASAARLVVEDQGPGVPPELRERIWERGVRGSDPVADRGAGLGLAIVREIAAAHEGRAYLDPAWAPGARFVIELPAH